MCFYYITISDKISVISRLGVLRKVFFEHFKDWTFEIAVVSALNVYKDQKSI